MRGVVFDLDDTLYPEEDFVRSGFRAVAAAFALELASLDDPCERMWREFSSGDRTRVFDAVMTAAGRAADPPLIARMVETYRTHMPALRLFPDAQRAMATLSGRVQLGILTDGSVATQRNKIAALGLTSRVDAIIVSDEFGREFWKPHIRCFQVMSQRLRCGPADLTYIADNPAKDFVAPNALGWTTIRIRRAGGIYANVPDAPQGAPHHVISTLDDLPGMLLRESSGPADSSSAGE